MPQEQQRPHDEEEEDLLGEEDEEQEEEEEEDIDLDDLIDINEEEAQQFINNYRQKGGQ